MTNSYEPPIHPAPAGVEAVWTKPPRPLEIWLAEDLDEVTQERYIQQAYAEHGIERRRRRRILPIPLAAGISATGDAVRHHRTAGTAATLGVLTAGGIALAVVQDDYQAHERPPAAHGSRRPVSPSATTPVKPPVRKPSPTTSPTTVRPSISAPQRSGTQPSPAATFTRVPHLSVPTRLPIRLPIPLSSKPGRPPVIPALTPPTAPAVRPACVVRVNAAGLQVRVCLHR